MATPSRAAMAGAVQSGAETRRGGSVVRQRVMKFFDPKVRERERWEVRKERLSDGLGRACGGSHRPIGRGAVAGIGLCYVLLKLAD